MGVHYSQPPRGYLYSDRILNDAGFSGVPSPLFANFSQMFTNDIKYEKDLPFIVTKSRTYTYFECLQVAHELKSIFAQKGFGRNKVKIMFYGSVSGEIMVLLTGALILGCEVTLVSNSGSDAYKMTKNVKEIDVIVCNSENIQEIANNYKSALVICNTLKSKFITVKQIIDNAIEKQKNILNEELSCPNENIIIIKNKKVVLGCENSMIYLDEWSEKMRICRDAKIASLLCIDDNLGRLLLYLTVYNRCSICFCNKLDEVKEFNPTHLFLPVEMLNEECERIKDEIAKKSFIFKGKYNSKYYWRRFWLTWKNKTNNDTTFSQFNIDFGYDFRFAFCNTIPSKENHELWTVSYSVPLSSVFLPVEWGNVGTSLPCDMKFTKYGTGGGPVGNAITFDEETKHIKNEIDGSTLELTGFWDEEGSLVIDQ